MSSEEKEEGPFVDGPFTVRDDDEQSRGSISTGSHPGQMEGPLTSADLVDLTGDKFCRVVMKQGPIPRVCGKSDSFHDSLP